VQSLRARLALRLAALYIVATTIAGTVLIYQAYETADTLNDRELSLRAADLAQYVSFDSGGTARVDLPPALATRYQAAGNADILRFAPGRMLFWQRRLRALDQLRLNGRPGRMTRAIFASRTSALKAVSIMA
jgi:hypothetical protein